jgi:hypothetical protein
VIPEEPVAVETKPEATKTKKVKKQKKLNHKIFSRAPLRHEEEEPEEEPVIEEKTEANAGKSSQERN